MSKALSQQEIELLLKQDANRRAANYIRQAWPSDADTIVLALAVKDDKESVVLSDGRTYKIRYKSHYDAVFVSPAKGAYVPCGYIARARLKEALLEDESQ